MRMAFGKAFKTLKEANAHAKKMRARYPHIEVRKMSKKLHPRREKLYHVGDYTDFINFA